MADDTVVALLAAGSARRFGGDKLDSDLAGKPVGMWAAEAAEIAGFACRLIITPPLAPRFVAGLKGWERVINPDPERGMASSIRTAAKAAAGSRRLVIMLADMPFVETEHLERIARETLIAFTQYPDGRRGVPAAFPADVQPAILALADGQRLARIDWGLPVVAIEPPSQRTLLDIDTQAKLDEITSALRSSP